MSTEQTTTIPDGLAARLWSVERTAKDATTRASLPQVLTDLALLEVAADNAQRSAVDAARAQGLSWAQIAEPMGITPQAAHKRYRDA